MCKYERQRLHLKLYLYPVAKYSLISYIHMNMKKITLLFLSFLVLSVLMISCAPVRKGCPTTNPKYFNQ